MSGHGTPPAEDMLAQAAAWRLRLTELGTENLLEFESWLADPSNAAAWRQVSYAWDYLSEEAHEPELIAARRAALGDARRASASRGATRVWRRAAQLAAALLVVGVVGWGGIVWLEKPDDYQTALGERRIITLTDGSKVSLDSNSEVTVRYSRNARELHLLRGQARFDVAHDVERPFSVLARNQKVIATGTAFNIDMAGQQVLVTLIEGHVVVLDEDYRVIDAAMPRPRLHPVELHSGQQLAAVAASAPEIQPANIQRVTAWTSGQIMFDNEPLSSVVARVNRYSSTEVVIDDPRVAVMRISGVFNVGDVPGFVDTVTHYLPVRAVTNESGTIVLASEPKG